MVSDRPDGEGEPAPRDATDSGVESPEGSSAYEALVMKYQDALRLISALEAQIDTLTQRLTTGTANDSSGPGPLHRTGDNSGLAERIDALERTAFLASIDALDGGLGTTPDVVRQPANEPPSTTPDSRRSAGPPPHMEIAQLRLQLTSLANRLAQSQGELKETQGSRSRRRSRHRPKNRPGLVFKLFQRWLQR